jgi:hypothetical protein
MNPLNGLMAATLDLYHEGNTKPHEKQIGSKFVGVDLTVAAPDSYALKVVHSYLPKLRDRFEEAGERVVLVSELLYRESNPELGIFGCAGIIPDDLATCLRILPRDRRPAVGLAFVRNGATLWKAAKIQRDQVLKIQAINYRLKLNGYVERGWLEDGELDRISREQYIALMQ